MKEITPSQLRDLRGELLKKQHYKCAICAMDLRGDPKNQHVDHQHVFKSQPLAVHGGGLIRGVLCRNCNVLEGKFWNAAHRYQQVEMSDPVGSRIKWLKSLISYYESNYQHYCEVLHPRERRPELLTKTEYNKILRWWKLQSSSKKKDGTLKPFPRYTGKWTKKLKEIAVKVRNETSL